MSNIIVETVQKEECHGCGNKKMTLNKLLFPYATMPIFLCDTCKNELLDKLEIK